MQEKQRVRVQSKEAVISLEKSTRLTAMRKSVEEGVNKELSSNKSLSRVYGEEYELQRAREAVRGRIAKIKTTYRQGMQHRLFALRFGSDEEIKQMTLQKLFKILNINQKLAKSLAEVKYGDNATSGG